jgi:hypothetical protein
MTTIFSKEIERLEKGCGINLSSYKDMCNKIKLCSLCKAKLQTLKQAEQKHLKFVEELKKEELEFLESLQGVLRTNKESSMRLDNRISKLKQEISNLSKGDGK